MKRIILVSLFFVLTAALFAENVGIVYAQKDSTTTKAVQFIMNRNKAQDKITYKVVGDKDLEKTASKYDFLLIITTKKTKEKDLTEFLDFAEENPKTSLILEYNNSKTEGLGKDGDVDVFVSPTPKLEAAPIVKGGKIEDAIMKQLGM